MARWAALHGACAFLGGGALRSPTAWRAALPLLSHERRCRGSGWGMLFFSSALWRLPTQQCIAVCRQQQCAGRGRCTFPAGSPALPPHPQQPKANTARCPARRRQVRGGLFERPPRYTLGAESEHTVKLAGLPFDGLTAHSSRWNLFWGTAAPALPLSLTAARAAAPQSPPPLRAEPPARGLSPAAAAPAARCPRRRRGGTAPGLRAAGRRGRAGGSSGLCPGCAIWAVKKRRKKERNKGKIKCPGHSSPCVVVCHATACVASAPTRPMPSAAHMRKCL